jgi:uncharacterized protein YkwD
MPYRAKKNAYFLRYSYLFMLAMLSFIMVFLTGCHVATVNISSPGKKISHRSSVTVTPVYSHEVRGPTGRISDSACITDSEDKSKLSISSNGASRLCKRIAETIDGYESIIRTEESAATSSKITEGTGIQNSGNSGADSSIDFPSEIAGIINSARNNIGGASLAQDKALNEVAKQRSDDMAGRDYFSHTTPEGKNIYNFLAEKGIPYATAGENIQFCSPPSTASPMLFFNTWMDSDMHRANILNGNFTKIGIGISSNNDKLFIVLVFTG